MKNIQFELDILEIPLEFPKLKVIEKNGEAIVVGKIDIIDNSGYLWSVFDIEITGSVKYPFSFPKLFETGDAFPKTLDWHVYEYDDKSCCIDIPENEVILCSNGLSALSYIKSYAIPYLANQEFRIREGYYLYGEYSHEVLGKIEYFQNKLGAKTLVELINMLFLIQKGYSPERPAYCPFCRTTKFRNCHKKVFVELAQLKTILPIDIFQLECFFISNPGFKLKGVY